ncbi:MAG: integrase core domain-containing protein [Dolichospermum sp.]
MTRVGRTTTAIQPTSTGLTKVDSARDIVLVRSKIRNNSANTPKRGLKLYRLNSAKNTTTIRPVTASRVLCHGEFFLEENTDTMIRALRSAFYKRGLPEQLLVDNGSIYCSQEITLICARVGCILRHTAVRDASAKGKIERFFRRVRDQFLIRNLDLSSLQSLNRQFTDWVEQDYNATIHSTLGMKPIDRFGVDLSRIRFLSPSQDTDELFYAEDTRTVKKDNTFSFQGDRYESPIDMRGREIVVRYERHRKGLPIVYDNGRRIGQARLLNAVANGLARRREE